VNPYPPDGNEDCVGSRLCLLSLAENEQLKDEPIIALAAHCFAKLHSLDLSGLHLLTDASIGASVLAGVELRCVRLLGVCELSDGPVLELAVRRGVQLCELSLNGCHKITDEAIHALEENCAAGLVRLDISWCRQVRDDALGRLADACVESGHWGAERAGRRSDGPAGSLLPSLKLWGMTQLSAKFHQATFFFFFLHCCACAQAVGRNQVPPNSC